MPLERPIFVFPNSQQEGRMAPSPWQAPQGIAHAHARATTCCSNSLFCLCSSISSRAARASPLKAFIWRRRGSHVAATLLLGRAPQLERAVP